MVAAAMVGGFIVPGTLTERLSRLGIKPIIPMVAVAGMTAFAFVQVAILLWWSDPWHWLWLLFGFLGTTGILSYAALAQSVPKAVVGRLITALNAPTLTIAFAVQWGIGSLVGLWPPAADGGYASEGYRAAFAVMLMLQGAALVWFWRSAVRAFRRPLRDLAARLSVINRINN